MSLAQDARFSRARSTRKGFTLVELLVVVSIISMLSYLLLPAVQGVRETARQVICKNNLSQIGKGVLAHVQASGGQFPTGGWGWSWAGDPQLGLGTNQHGGWVFNILPFIDQESLYRLGAGVPYDGPGEENMAGAAALRLTVPVDTFYCPSRRQALAYHFNQGVGGGAIYHVAVAMRTDYAINAGSQNICQGGQAARIGIAVPGVGSGGPTPPMQLPGLLIGLDVTFQRMNTGQVGTGNGTAALTGVSFLMSQVRESDLDSDGAHNVYLVGEKGVCANHYLDGFDGGDNENAYTGWNNDVFRTAQTKPVQDGVPNSCLTATTNGNGMAPCVFGSPHSGYFHMVFCDGSVRAVHYDIDINLHRKLANRHDGAQVDLSQL